MTTYRELTAQAADQWVAALKNAERILVAGSRRVADATPAPVADLSSSAPFAKLSEVIGDNLPKPAEIVEANFDFANRVLMAQRDFTLHLLEASASQQAPAPAKKPAARKSTAKRPAAKRPAAKKPASARKKA